MNTIVVGTKIKAKGHTGWIGTVVAIGLPPKSHRPKIMPRFAHDLGDTVWIDWGGQVLGDQVFGDRQVIYGYPMSTIQKLEVVNS
jgi:hypothetical protein